MNANDQPAGAERLYEVLQRWPILPPRLLATKLSRGEALAYAAGYNAVRGETDPPAMPEPLQPHPAAPAA